MRSDENRWIPARRFIGAREIEFFPLAIDTLARGCVAKLVSLDDASSSMVIDGSLILSNSLSIDLCAETNQLKRMPHIPIGQNTETRAKCLRVNATWRDTEQRYAIGRGATLSCTYYFTFLSVDNNFGKSRKSARVSYPWNTGPATVIYIRELITCQRVHRWFN